MNLKLGSIDKCLGEAGGVNFREAQTYINKLLKKNKLHIVGGGCRLSTGGGSPPVEKVNITGTDEFDTNHNYDQESRIVLYLQQLQPG